MFHLPPFPFSCLGFLNPSPLLSSLLFATPVRSAPLFFSSLFLFSPLPLVLSSPLPLFLSSSLPLFFSPRSFILLFPLSSLCVSHTVLYWTLTFSSLTNVSNYCLHGKNSQQQYLRSNHGWIFSLQFGQSFENGTCSLCLCLADGFLCMQACNINSCPQVRHVTFSYLFISGPQTPRT